MENKELIELYLSTSVADILYYPEINTIETYWKRQPNTEEYKLTCLQGLDAVKEKSAFGYLVDLTHQGAVSVDNRKWFEETIGIKVNECLIKKTAIVLNNDIFKNLYVEALKHLAGKMPLATFSNREEAFNWLGSLKNEKKDQ